MSLIQHLPLLITLLRKWSHILGPQSSNPSLCVHGLALGYSTEQCLCFEGCFNLFKLVSHLLCPGTPDLRPVNSFCCFWWTRRHCDSGSLWQHNAYFQKVVWCSATTVQDSKSWALMNVFSTVVELSRPFQSGTQVLPSGKCFQIILFIIIIMSSSLS